MKNNNYYLDRVLLILGTITILTGVYAFVQLKPFSIYLPALLFGSILFWGGYIQWLQNSNSRL